MKPTPHKISRRTLLLMLGASGLSLYTPHTLRAAPTAPSPALTRLRDELTALIGDLEIGLDVRHVNPQNGYEYARVQINADKLYPVASSFKTFAVLFYFWNMPRAGWEYAEGSPAYSTAVFSNNTMTAAILEQASRHIDVYGDAVDKFNDFLLYTLGFENGLYSWNWENSLTQGMSDFRFEPSAERYVDFHGGRFRMDNLFTTAELADGYALLMQPNPFPDVIYANEAIAKTLELISIPAANFEAPIERAFGRPYTGKDGVLPERDSVIGGVLNDAGIIHLDNGTYILSFMCAGEGEYVGLNVLREVARLLNDFDLTL